MTIKHLFTAIFSILLFSSFSLTETTTYYIAISDLNTENYKEIKTASLERNDIRIESVCIPAGIIKIAFSGANDSAETALRIFFNESSEIQDIEFPENFTEENYFEKCSNARVGR